MKDNKQPLQYLEEFKEYIQANDKDANVIGWTMIKNTIKLKDMSLNDLTHLYIDMQRFYYNNSTSMPKEAKNFRFKVIKWRCKHSKVQRANSYNKICAEMKKGKEKQ